MKVCRLPHGCYSQKDMLNDLKKHFRNLTLFSLAASAVFNRDIYFKARPLAARGAISAAAAAAAAEARQSISKITQRKPSLNKADNFVILQSL
jgi:hypothetical protein